MEKGTFVAVSDFHSTQWPIEKVEQYYVNEYDKVLILGDSTDRGPKSNGTGGVDLLFRIKRLTEKYPGKVIYVPGNHDQFVYNYLANGDNYGKQYQAIRLMEMNGGTKTIEDLEKLSESQKKELAEWLGNLPLQIMIEDPSKGKEISKYAFAHAFFDQKIYDKYPNFCLKDGESGLIDNDDYMRIIWFRKGRKDYFADYDPSSLPAPDVTEVIGHTPNENLRLKLDLENDKGETIHVVDVDIGYDKKFDGLLFKYDGNNRKAFYDPIPTKDGIHVNTSGTGLGVQTQTENKNSARRKVDTFLSGLSSRGKKRWDSIKECFTLNSEEEPESLVHESTVSNSDNTSNIPRSEQSEFELNQELDDLNKELENVNNRITQVQTEPVDINSLRDLNSRRKVLLELIAEVTSEIRKRASEELDSSKGTEGETLTGNQSFSSGDDIVSSKTKLEDNIHELRTIIASLESDIEEEQKNNPIDFNRLNQLKQKLEAKKQQLAELEKSVLSSSSDEEKKQESPKTYDAPKPITIDYGPKKVVPSETKKVDDAKDVELSQTIDISENNLPANNVTEVFSNTGVDQDSNLITSGQSITKPEDSKKEVESFFEFVNARSQEQVESNMAYLFYLKKCLARKQEELEEAKGRVM